MFRESTQPILKLIYFIFFTIFVRPLSYLPLTFLYVLSDGFYYILRYFLRYRIVVIEKNLTNAFPTYSTVERKKIIKDYYHFLADVMAENVKGLTISDREIDQRMHYEGLELLSRYKDENRNVTLLTGHSCNFEWMLMTINKFLPQPVYSFYVEIGNPYFRKLILNNRTRNGLQLLQAKDASAFYKDASIQNFANIFASDQSPSNPDKALWTKFLHQHTAFVMGADKYSRQKNCAVVYMAMKRIDRGSYSVTFQELCSDIQTMNSTELLNAYVNALENTIIEQPACWLWSHNRWKHQPKIKVKEAD